MAQVSKAFLVVFQYSWEAGQSIRKSGLVDLSLEVQYAVRWIGPEPRELLGVPLVPRRVLLVARPWSVARTVGSYGVKRLGRALPLDEFGGLYSYCFPVFLRF